jgi:hypothetical protein
MPSFHSAASSVPLRPKMRAEPMLSVVRCDDRAFAKLGDWRRDELDGIARERRVVVVGKQHALAAHAIGRREFFAQFGIGDLGLQKTLCDALAGLQYFRVDHETVGAHFEQPVDDAALQPGVAGQMTAAPALSRRNRAIAARHHPRSGALKDGEPFCVAGDFGDDLDRARARADDGDVLAAQIGIRIPR